MLFQYYHLSHQQFSWFLIFLVLHLVILTLNLPSLIVFPVHYIAYIASPICFSFLVNASAQISLPLSFCLLCSLWFSEVSFCISIFIAVLSVTNNCFMSFSYSIAFTYQFLMICFCCQCIHFIHVFVFNLEFYNFWFHLPYFLFLFQL